MSSFLLEGGERGVVEGFDAVLDAADALVQRFVLLGLAGKERVFLAQALQLFALFREILDQGMVFDVHGNRSGCQEGLYLIRPPGRTG
jgi:hypothetical protein